VSIRRRDLLAGGAAAGALLAGGVLVPVGIVLTDNEESTATGALLASYSRLRIASASDLAVGDTQFFDYPWEAASNILVRASEPVLGGIGDDRDLVAFSNQCTHMGCPITEYHPDNHVLGPCPCHFSSFDLSRDGIASFGQATQNLPRVLLELEGDDIYATGVFRLIYGHADNLAGESLVEVRT
jgi:arsenite oxidase small subunit